MTMLFYLSESHKDPPLPGGQQLGLQGIRHWNAQRLRPQVNNAFVFSFQASAHSFPFSLFTFTPLPFPHNHLTTPTTPNHTTPPTPQQPHHTTPHHTTPHQPHHHRDKVTLAVLELLERGEMVNLETKWWDEKGECKQTKRSSKKVLAFRPFYAVFIHLFD